jgi:hypothetical protein
MIERNVGIFWLKVSNIPRSVKLRDLWDTLSEFAPISEIQMEDPLPYLGRDCFVQVLDSKAMSVFLSASFNYQIRIANTPLIIRESENPENITFKNRDKQRPSQRRLFLLRVPRSVNLVDLGSLLTKMVGPFESLKEVRLHPSEYPVESDTPMFQVVTILFTNCNQVELLLSGKLDLDNHPLFSGIRLRKFLALRLNKDKVLPVSRGLNSYFFGSKTQAMSGVGGSEMDVNYPGTWNSEGYPSSASKMRTDVNDHHHRLKPTSTKYFENYSRRNIAPEGPSQHGEKGGYSFKIMCRKPR